MNYEIKYRGYLEKKRETEELEKEDLNINLYSIITKKVKLKDLITIPSLLYYILVVCIYFGYKNMRFVYYDEFMFWGTNVKLMFSKNALWADSMIDAVHQVYPPFSGVTQYVFCKLNNGFSEGICYVALIVLMATPLLLIFRKDKSNIKTIAKFFIIYFIYFIAIRVFRYDIINLSVDCLLAVIFSVSIYFAHSMNVNSKKDLLILSLLLVTLTLIKTNGILFAAITVGVIFVTKMVDIIAKRDYKLIKKLFILVLTLILVALAAYLIWTLYYKLNGKQIDDRHDKNTVAEVKAENETILQNFKKGLQNKIIINKATKSTTYWVLGYINAIAIILIILNKNKVKNLIFLLYINVGFVIYTLSILYVFLFVFIEYQGVTLMGFERYITTYLLAFLLAIVLIASESNKKRNWVVILAVTGLLLLYMDWSNLRYSGKEPILNQKANYINEQTDEKSKIYIIDEKLDYGVDFQKLRYMIVPRQTNLLYEWNISTTDNNIYYQRKIEPQELFKELKDNNYDYVYILNITTQFLDEYKELFKEEDLKILEKNLRKETSVGILFKIGDSILELKNYGIFRQKWIKE